MRILSFLFFLTIVSSPLFGVTREISHTDSEGKTYTAVLTIDDRTHHVVSMSGTDCSGREWSVMFKFAPQLSRSGISGSYLQAFSLGGYWFNVAMNRDGTLKEILRYGGPGYSKERYVYVMQVPSVTDDVSNPEIPIYR